MKIESYLILVIIIAMLATGAFTVQANWSAKYSSYGAEDLTVAQESRMTAIDDMNTIGENMQDRLLSLSTKATALDISAIYDLAGLFVDVGAYLLQVPNVMWQTAEVIFDALKIAVPTWFATGVMTLIGLLFVMKLVAIYLKREEL